MATNFDRDAYLSRLTAVTQGRPYAWAAKHRLQKSLATSLLAIKQKPQRKTLAQIEAKTGLSSKWLFYGEGPQWLAEHAQPSDDRIGLASSAAPGSLTAQGGEDSGAENVVTHAAFIPDLLRAAARATLVWCVGRSGATVNKGAFVDLLLRCYHSGLDTRLAARHPEDGPLRTVDSCALRTAAEMMYDALFVMEGFYVPDGGDVDIDNEADRLVLSYEYLAQDASPGDGIAS